MQDVNTGVESYRLHSDGSFVKLMWTLTYKRYSFYVGKTPFTLSLSR